MTEHKANARGGLTVYTVSGRGCKLKHSASCKCFNGILSESASYIHIEEKEKERKRRGNSWRVSGEF